MEKLNEFLKTILQIEKTIIFMENKDLQNQFLETIQTWVQIRSNQIQKLKDETLHDERK
jgi:hypothetical protein